MKQIILTMALLFSTTQANAMYEITKPEEMTNCMKTYISNWLAAPYRVRTWEHVPQFEFAGKYFTASWHSDSPTNPFGTLDLMVGPNAPAPIYCDYPTDESGAPDITQGFCKAEVENADVEFSYRTFPNGKPEVTQKKIAYITNSKIYCLNLKRP